MNTERSNNGNAIPSLAAKSNAGNDADVILWADPSTHRLLVDANVSITGLTAVDDSAFVAGTGTGTPIMGFATADTVDSGDVGVVGMTTGRALFVYIKGTDVGASGGTSMVDDAAFTAGTTAITPMGAMFDDTSPDSVDEGDGGVVRMSGNRNLYTTIRDAAGNERGVNVNASNQLAVAGPVTNAGTFVVQENGAALTALQLIDDIIIADDAAFTPGTTKVAMVGATFDDVAPDSVNEGDAGAVRMSANRNLYVTLRDAAGNERGLNIDASGQLAITLAAGQTLGTVTTVGTVTAMGVGTSGPMKAEDVAHATGDMGFAVWTVRQDTLATTAANGDYVPFSTDSIGALYTRDTATLVDDAAFTPATSRVMPIGFMVDDTGTDSVDEGDAGAPRMSADRIIYVQGAVAHDAADAGNPLKIGGKALATPSTATMVADADRANATMDLDGAQLVHLMNYGDLISERVSNTDGNSTAFTNFGATASTRNYITAYSMFRTDAGTTPIYVDIRDGTAGSVLWSVVLPPNGGANLASPIPLFRSTANTALAFDVSAATTTVYISVTGFKSKV